MAIDSASPTGALVSPNILSEKTSQSRDDRATTDNMTAISDKITTSAISKSVRLPTIRSDLAFAFFIIAILVVLIFPMPAFLLDYMLAGSIIFSVLILMTVLFIEKPLEFSAFPAVLLIATMLRLALNLASTRLILAYGHDGTTAAGLVIEGFGNLVMQGSFVIGMIIFVILILVNFVVITKGSGRIAEVSARFTLDAMPGKQMAIDSDLAAGLISDDDARKRRKELEEESSFFGAMDGASKFVRGDAIAGLLITLINIFGGIIVGVIGQGIDIVDASKTYTVLTVGDGLVTQIPALIVSTAAGLLMSKAGVSGAADRALAAQLTGYPKALAMSSLVMAIIAVLPGMPFMPFATLAAIAGYFAYYANDSQDETLTQPVASDNKTKKSSQAVDAAKTALNIDDVRIELGYALIGLMDDGNEHKSEREDDEDRLTNQIKALRRQIASELGYVMPPVRIIDNMNLDANDYMVKIKEIDAGKGTIYPDKYMVMDPNGNEIVLDGINTSEPTFGLPATWIDADLQEEAAIQGLTVVDAPTVITTHLTETIKSNIAELISYSDIHSLLDGLSSEQHKLIEDMVPNNISISGIQRILQNLLAERVSIRDLPAILEAIADIAVTTRAPQIITEHVRKRLARQISYQYMSPNGYLPLVTLSPEWENELMQSLTDQGEVANLALAPPRLQALIHDLRNAFEMASASGELPVLLVTPALRPHIRSLIERIRPQTAVISQAEIYPKIRLKSLASV